MQLIHQQQHPSRNAEDEDETQRASASNRPIQSQTKNASKESAVDTKSQSEEISYSEDGVVY